MIYCIRGAITIEENTKQNIVENTTKLLNTIIKENNIKIEEIINVLFSSTKDITKAYPAVATRNIGITECAVMCFQEMYVEESLKMCIRVMLTIRTKMTCKDSVRHIYLKDAKKLRPDIYSSNTSVAIDGPAGSGKSTVSKMVARELNFIYVDTGAMFRAMTLYCLKKGIDLTNEKDIAKDIDKIDISLRFVDGEQQIYLNGKDVSSDIREQNISKNVSDIAKIGIVRKKLLKIQQEMAKDKNVVMDGRDIGTSVLPNANVKIYLDADIKERAKRRHRECLLKGEKISYDDIEKNILQRDDIDKNREISPLKKAEDAICIDTTGLNIYEVCEKIIKIIKENIK